MKYTSRTRHKSYSKDNFYIEQMKNHPIIQLFSYNLDNESSIEAIS